MCVCVCVFVCSIYCECVSAYCVRQENAVKIGVAIGDEAVHEAYHRFIGSCCSQPAGFLAVCSACFTLSDSGGEAPTTGDNPGCTYLEYSRPVATEKKKGSRTHCVYRACICVCEWASGDDHNTMITTPGLGHACTPARAHKHAHTRTLHAGSRAVPIARDGQTLCRRCAPIRRM